MSDGVRILRTAPAATPVLLCLSLHGSLGSWASALTVPGGFHALQAASAEDAAALARSCRPDLLLLHSDTIDGCNRDELPELRCSHLSRLPTIILQSAEANGSALADLVEAEDVLPSDLDVITTAIRLCAVLRRARPSALTARLIWRDLELRQDERRVHAAGNVLSLSFHEFNLVALLMEEPGRLWSREDLRIALLGTRTRTASKSLARIAQAVRRRLEPCLGRPAIEAVRGVGYRLV